jgi:hypothetical protein
MDYDPCATDPEGLAAAMDRLLKTAVSIPSVLDEYGNPKFSQFLVLPASSDSNESGQGEIAGFACATVRDYRLAIDGPLFRLQRQMLLRLADPVHQGLPFNPSAGDAELLEGLLQLTDEIADQAHDRFGVDCLLDADDRRCECEKPGYFYSGVPGIIAPMENGRLAPGAEVERCDLCQRFPSDAAALARLRELGRVDP